MIGTKSWASRLFDVCNYTILSFMACITVLPFIYIIACSLATSKEVAEKGFILFPRTFSLQAYKYIFASDSIVSSLLITVFITVVGTFVNLLLTSIMAYPLSRRDLDGRRVLLFFIVFTILFNGGMIPLYLVVKATGFINSLWSLIIPSAVNPLYLIIMKNFFQQLPDGIEESAKIDGYNDLSILLRIVLPLSMPAMATFALFYSVFHWNTFYHAIFFINDPDKYPIQVLLREIVIIASGEFSTSNADSIDLPAQTLKMAVIVVSTLPILLVFPFVQKHFTKGVFLGSVKG